jgi:Amt family ammonium transporter
VVVAIIATQLLIVWSAGVTLVLLKLASTTVPPRVSREHGLEGLDISQRGEALR